MTTTGAEATATRWTMTPRSRFAEATSASPQRSRADQLLDEQEGAGWRPGVDKDPEIEALVDSTRQEYQSCSPRTSRPHTIAGFEEQRVDTITR